MADLSVMLALMAGRNGGKALEHVKNDEVECPVQFRFMPAAVESDIQLLTTNYAVG